MLYAFQLIAVIVLAFPHLGVGADLAYLQTIRSDFIVPATLRPTVNFWKQIYTHYSVHEIVIHHRDYPHIIYESVNLEKWYGTPEYSQRHATRLIKARKAAIADQLRRLHAYRTQPDTLTPAEYTLFRKFAGIGSDRKFLHAASHIRSQQGLHERFKEGLQRQGQYIDAMLNILQEEGVPQELAVLPHVESSFNYNAYSKYGAAGIWQFTRSTGRHFLKINRYVDERKDPIVATHAAARLLKQNYGKTGSWPLAILAYNHGINGVRRAIRQVGSVDIVRILNSYRSRSFGFASKNFYPEFLAALEIVRHYKDYFGSIQFDSPLAMETFKLHQRTHIPSLIKGMDIDPVEFAHVNPAISRYVKNGRYQLPAGYSINILKGQSFDVRQRYANYKRQAPEAQELEQRVTVNAHPSILQQNLFRTDHLSSITSDSLLVIEAQPEESLWLYAQWAGCTLHDIVEANSFSRRTKPTLHQEIIIPIQQERAAQFNTERKTFHEAIRRDFLARNEIYQIIEHRVAYGESVWYLCFQIYEIPFWLLQQFNEHVNWNYLPVGAKLIIPMIRAAT